MQEFVELEHLLEEAKAFKTQDGRHSSLCLAETFLEHSDSKGRRFLLSLADVVGATVTQRNDARGSSYLLGVYAYPRRKKWWFASRCDQKRCAGHLQWLVRDGDTARRWSDAINLRAGGQHSDGSPRRLLVVINPVSGTGDGRSIWSSTLRPMLKQAGVYFKTITTSRRGQISELLRQTPETTSSGTSFPEHLEGTKDPEGLLEELDPCAGTFNLDSFTGVVAVGGDGTMFEVCQRSHSACVTPYVYTY
ncbi:unnamed protein product [Choristocarpus tenellus]